MRGRKVDEDNDLKYFDITNENRREISKAEYDGEVINRPLK